MTRTLDPRDVRGVYRPLHPFDSRVVRRYVGEGFVTENEYKAHLASLPDLAGKFDEVDPTADGELATRKTAPRYDYDAPEETPDEE